MLFVFVLISAAKHDSQTIDEAVHLSAGYSYVRTGDWRLNPEHPPLVKFIAGLFVLPASPSLPLESAAWQGYQQWDFGRLFLYHNTVPAETLLFLGRLAVILFSLGLAVAIWYYATRMFGRFVGLLALGFTVFEPTILAHGHLVTTDIPLSLTFFLSIMTFSDYLQRPRTKTLLLSIGALALALLTKYSAVVLIPTLLGMYVVYRWYRQPQTPRPLGFWKILILFLAGTSFIIWAGYGFQIAVPGTDPRISRLYQERAQILSDGTLSQQPSFVQDIIKVFDPTTQFGSGVKHFLETTPIPAYSFWRGLTTVFSHNETGHGSYLLGQTSIYGWWYYFPLAYLFKTPLTFLILLGIGWVVAMKTLIQKFAIVKLRSLSWHWYILTIPPIFYWYVSITSHINLGIRHLTPLLPFVIITCAVVAQWLWRRNAAGKYLTSFLCLGLVISSASYFPAYLPYFNEAVGGAVSGHQLLLDSNLDWGQELGSLGAYMKEHHIDNPRVAYFGSAEISYYIPNARALPSSTDIAQIGIPHDVMAISAGVLFDPNQDFQWLLNYTPAIVLGHAFYVYDFR